MEKTKLKIVALAAGLMVVIGGGSLYIANHNTNKTTNTPPAATQSSQSAAKLMISNSGKTASYEGQTGKTALEVLKSLGDVTTKQSSYGEFVTGISGVQADGTKQFWAFYVNGKLASEGAGTYKSTNGEKLEWRVEDVQQ